MCQQNHKHNHCHCHDRHDDKKNNEDHHHDEGDLKGKLGLIIVTALLLVGAVIVEKTCQLATWQLLLVYLVPYLLIGHETLKEAAEGIAHRDAYNENLLMSVATIGALSIGFFPGAETEFAEAVFVMLFFQVGELFEGYAEGRSRDSISHLMDIRPDTANVIREGKITCVAPQEVTVGETIVVKPGEKIALDGIVTEGTSTLNTIALTGESMPREVKKDDEVTSGCINLSGVLHIRTSKLFGESTVSKIIQLVEEADEHKSRSESFITRFARIYTPIVVWAAIALAFIPPFFTEVGFASAFPTWLHRALIFLIVSCPCALVISVPLSFFTGLGAASRKGVLVKGSNYMDALAKMDTVVFDKTGTLTQGKFAVTAIHPDHFNEKDLLHLAAHVEHFSTHPIGAALRDAFPNEAHDGCVVEHVEEIAGQGIRALVKVNCNDAETEKGKTHVVCVGNARMMEALKVEWHDCHKVGTIIHVAVDGRYAGHIVITDCVKPESKQALAQLKRLGVRHTVMLTGDREEVAREVAEDLGIDEFHANLLPADKVAHVERLLRQKPAGTTLAFVGDGINDAPVLKRADLGIAMGALGSDAAIEAADVVLMDDNTQKIATAIRIARRTLRIAQQNVWFAIGVKIAVLALASVGIGTLWMAVFADVGVTVLAVLNAMR